MCRMEVVESDRVGSISSLLDEFEFEIELEVRDLVVSLVS